MTLIIGILIGIVISFLWSFYRFIRNGMEQRDNNHSYVQDILSTNEGVDFATKFLYVKKDETKDFDMYNWKPNEKNIHFELYAPLRNWYENC